jgi:hypothetical protein
LAITLDQTNVGSAANSASSTTLALVTSNIVAVGATIFISGIANAATVSSVSGGSISWVVDTTSATTNAFASLIRGYASAGLASGSTITLTYNVADTGKMARQYLQDGPYIDPPVTAPLNADVATTAVSMWSGAQFTPLFANDAKAGKIYVGRGGRPDHDGRDRVR